MSENSMEKRRAFLKKAGAFGLAALATPFVATENADAATPVKPKNDCNGACWGVCRNSCELYCMKSCENDCTRTCQGVSK